MVDDNLSKEVLRDITSDYKVEVGLEVEKIDILRHIALLYV